MSWYNSVVLSFSTGEFDGEKPPAKFGPLRKINSWLKKRKYDSLSDLSGGTLGSNAILFGGCYNYLDVGEFLERVNEQKWAYPEDVQVLFWHDNASKFSVIHLPPKRPPVHSIAKAKKAASPRTRKAKTQK